TEIGPDAPRGLCPRCLADVGVADIGVDSDECALVVEPQAIAGQTIGDYQILEEIGHGGMGMVYRARQRTLNREVALKTIKPDMDSSEVLVRFDAERAVLARMDHPNIARVIDAGTTPGGRPYFVMELVQGTPITRYCDEYHLPLLERLNLFTSSVMPF